MKKVWTSISVQLSKLGREQGAGFTLLELLIVIAILGTLAGIAIPVYSHQIEKARTTKAVSEIRLLDKEILLFRMDNDVLPNTLDDIGYGNFPDPWGNPYQFANHANISPGQRRKYKSTVPLNTDYDLYSMGPDGDTKPPITSKAGYDDIIRASDGDYIGPASEF